METKSLAIAIELLSSEDANDRIAEDIAIKIFNTIGPSDELDDLVVTLGGYKLAVALLNDALEAERKKTPFRRLLDKIK